MAINTIYNVLGQVTPMLLAVWAIPELIAKLGIDRFGLLTIAWAVIGYFNLFDLGLGRALTQAVAEKIGMGQESDIPVIVWTGNALMIALGIIGVVIVSLITPWLVQTINMPEALQLETTKAFYMLALGIPIVISTAGLRGVLEAQQRFDLTNIVRTAMGIFTFVGPLLVLPFSQSIFVIVCVLVIGRFFFWIVHVCLCMYSMPALRNNVELKFAVVGSLIRFGGWMTVSNIISPIMVYMDRFIIGALLTVTAVTYYTTPYEVVTKLLVIPSALVGVVFPAFSASFASNPSQTARLFERGVKGVAIVMFPIIFGMIIFAAEGLSIWIGEAFTQNSTSVLRWLAIGVFINGLAGIPYALVQGAGRPDITAKLHVIELPFYLLMLWWLLTTRGIEGAALAWMLRAAVDALLLFLAVKKLLLHSASLLRNLAVIIGGTITALILLVVVMDYLIIGFAVKGLAYLLLIGVFVLIAWFQILSTKDRELLVDRLC